MSDKTKRPCKPAFIIKPRRQFVDEGQTAKFKASFDGEPPPRVTWHWDGNELKEGAKYKFSSNSDFHFLEVQDVASNDKGSYICTLRNDLGQATSAANLEVYANLKTRWVSKNPPKLERALSERTVTDGDKNITIDCVVTGSPEPTITWAYEGKLIKISEGIKQTYDGHTAKLVFPDVFIDDNGLYECVAKNTNGEVSTKARLTVRGKNVPTGSEVPVFISAPQSQTVIDGARVLLECKLRANPEPKIVWYKGAKQVKTTKDFKPSFDGTIVRLEIREVYPEDQAEYTCVAKNLAGEARTKCKLIVKDPPKDSPKVDANQNSIKTNGTNGHSQKSKTIENTAPTLPTLPTTKSKPLKTIPKDVNVQSDIKNTINKTLPPPQIKTKPPATEPASIMPVNEKTPTSTKGGIADRMSKFLSKSDTTTTKTIHNSNNTTTPSSTKSNSNSTSPPSNISNSMSSRRATSNSSSREQNSLNKSNNISSRNSSNEFVSNNNTKSPPRESTTAKSPPPSVAPKTSPKRIARTAGPPTFIKRLSDMSALDGDRVELSVEVQATGPVEVIWLHSDKEIPKSSTVYTQESSGNVHWLVINEVFPEDAGMYVCEIYNDIGDDDSTCNLTVKDRAKKIGNGGPNGNSSHNAEDDIDDDAFDDDNEFFRPEFVKTPKGAHVDEGMPITFTCQVIANPPAKLHWEKDGVMLENEPGRYVMSYNSTSEVYSLQIVQTVGADLGRYTASATNSEGTRTCSVSLNVTELDKADVEDFRNVLKARPAAKKMEALFNSKTYIEGEQKDFRAETLQQTGVKTKTLNVVDRRRSGDQVDFRPVALDRKGIQTRISQTFDAQQIDFRGVLGNQGVETKADTYLGYEGEQQDFRELLSPGTEPTQGKAPTYNLGPGRERCARDSGTDSERESEQADFRGVLNIRSPNSHSNSGSDREGAEQMDFRGMLANRVETKVRPRVVSDLADVTASDGGSVTLECMITGIPEPRIRWYADKKEIKESKYFQMSYVDSVARLVIAEVYPEDEGEYMCKAKNEKGSVETSCEIAIVHGGSLEAEVNDTSETGVAADSMEPPMIEEISPENVQVLRGADFQIKAKFVGEPKPTVTWFKDKAELQYDSRVCMDIIRDTAVLSVTSTEPSDSGRYTVTVENELGRDTCTASVTIEDIPNPPAGEIHFTNVEETQLTLSWYGPSYDGGSCITDYRVEMATVPDSEDILLDWITLTSNCKYTSHHVKNLTPNNEFLFRVSAANKHGFSIPGEETSIATVRRRGSIKEVDKTAFEHRVVTIDPDRVFDKNYTIMEEIGKGRFGNVHKCKHKEYPHLLAVKFVRVKTTTERKTIKMEIDAMNNLEHKNLGMLYDAFETPKEMILVMEFVRGGELFDRITDEDYSLSEKECVHFMKQVCEGVKHMHERNILHLDLKPENIVCSTRNSNEIKIIDFGLARKFDPKDSIRIMFGTPEFVAPEVVNYEQIGFTTDLWSVGVICYILLSGLSPFMGDKDSDTLSNVTAAQWDFEDDAFDDITDDAKNFIEKLLMKNLRKRMSATECLEHTWLSQDVTFMKAKRLSTDKHKGYLARKKWQKTGTAIRALGRMACQLRNMTGRKASDPAYSRSWSTVSAPAPSSLKLPFKKRSNTDELLLNDNADSGIELDTKSKCSTDTADSTPEDVVKPTVKSKKEEQSSHVSNTYTSKATMSINSKPDASLNNDKPYANKVLGRRRFEANTTTKSTEANKHTTPRFVKAMRNFEVFEGNVARFDVHVSGDPTPDVKWLKDGLTLNEESGKYIFERTKGRGLHTLTIKDCGESDDAQYTCCISNLAGQASCKAELYVEGAERPFPK